MLRPNVDVPPSSSNFEALQKPLDQFRAKTRRLQVHPAEQVVLWAVCAHLVFLPWALGSTRSWAQIVSFCLSAIGFGLALIPRNYTEEHTGSNRFRLIMWPKLVKFPIFWIGLALLGYIAIQGSNPAWRYETDGARWWMRAIEHKAWLPVGVEAPFEKWNPWRMLMIYSSTWMTVCAIWIGFTRRRTVQLFLMTLAFNGLLLAGLGMAQRLLGNGKIFWFFTSPNPQFFASFIYKNHAGAYLNLTLAVTCGLGAWYYLRGLRRMEKSNPSGVFAFFATAIAVSILTSYARGATLVMLAFLCICIAAFVIHQFAVPNENRKPVIVVVLILVFGYFAKTGLDALQTGEAWDRIRQGITRQDTSLAAREMATTVSIEMLKDTGLKGVGSGGFRFIFPVYQYRHPELLQPPLFWEHAHNDIVQFPIELGIVGMLLVAAGGGFWLLALAKSYFWENPLSACIAFGLVLTLVYGWWDFPLQCPAILTTWCALWATITMWTRFEEQNIKG